MTTMHAAALRQPKEVADAIYALTPAQWLRLRKIASALARTRPIETEDLLQEALSRGINGSRNCPADVDVVRFLAEAMRSIAHGELEKASAKPTLVPVARFGDEQGAVDPVDPGPGADEILASKQETALIRAAVLKLFEEDPVAEVIVEGIMDEMEGAELQELSGLDSVAYQSKRKLIRRRLDSKFPKGWK